MATAKQIKYNNGSTNNATTTTITTANTLYKANFTNTDSYKTKFTIDNNRITYQPVNGIDCMAWISCNVAVNNTNRNVDIALVKNGAIVNGVFGRMTTRCTTANQVCPVTTNCYLPDVAATNFYEIRVTSSINGDVVTVQDVARLTDSK